MTKKKDCDYLKKQLIFTEKQVKTQKLDHYFISRKTGKILKNNLPNLLNLLID